MDRAYQVLANLHSIFIVQRYQGRNQIGPRLAAFAPFAMTVAAGRVIGGKAAVDGFLRIDFESSGSAAAAATSSTTGRCRCPLGTRNRNRGEDGNSQRHSDS